MSVLSTVSNRVARAVTDQRVAIREDGVITYLRSRPQATLGWMGSILLSYDSRRMSPTDVQNEWAGRSGTYSPTFYAALGETGGTASIRSVLDARVDHDAAVLELGCSAGRNLEHLRANGYENLSGIDINENAFDVMAESYPELAREGTFYQDALEDVLPTFDDRQFDVVFSVETLQHIHPDNDWLFDEVVRITDDVLITKENEPDDDQLLTTNHVDGFPLYHRDWQAIFTDRGLTHVTQTTDSVDTLRVFHRPDFE